MITFDQRTALHELTGLPRQHFGKLYRTRGANEAGEGAIFYWVLGNTEDPVRFAPAEAHLASPEGFAKKLRLTRPPDAARFVPLIREIMAGAVVI
jgi:hypothetical protein